MLRFTSRLIDWRRLLLAGLFLACIVALAPSDAAMQVKPGWKAIVRLNPTSGSARIPAPRKRAGAPQATITVTYHNFSAQAQTAFQAAVDIWASTVYSPVPIRIDASWTSLGSTTGILGQAGPTEVFSSFTGAPISATWYPKALANALAGKDLDSTQVDISAEFNSAFPDWYLGTDGNTPSNLIDLETVVLHECCHGLGFIGSAAMSSGSGSWGFNNNPMIYDRFTVNGSNQAMINTSLFPNPSTALGAQLTGDNLFLNGPKAIAANNGAMPKLYAPSSWEQGSSVSHLDENTYPFGSSINALMTPALPFGISLHDPGPIVKGFFADMGWTTTIPTVATPTFSPDGGTYTATQNVTINSMTTGASIYYTTNGIDPTTSDTRYQSPVSITATTTLKAKAFASGMTASAVKSALYTINIPLNFTITPSAGANGAIFPNTPQTEPGGSSVVFTATPSVGFTVDSWLVDSAVMQVGGSQFTLNNITVNHNVQVTFKALTFTVTPSAGTGGAISPGTAQILNAGGSVTFTAKPNTGYQVAGWTFDGNPVYIGGKAANGAYTGLTLGVNNVSANHSVAVTFAQVVSSFTVTPSAGTGGTITPNTVQTVTTGGNVSFTAKPNTGYQVAGWTYDGNPLYIGGNAANGLYTGLTLGVNNVSANHTVAVTFKSQGYTITPTAGANGAISPNTPQTVVSGGSVTFTAKPNTGYLIASWMYDGKALYNGGNAANGLFTGSSIVVNNMSANHAVGVTFKATLNYQPDLSICNNGDAAYIGLGTLNLDSTGQTKAQTVAGGVAATYLFRVENAGNTTDTFTLTCPLPSQSGWQVQCIDRITSLDITTALTGSGYTTVALAPGVAGGLTLKVTPTSAVTSGTTFTLLITGASVKGPTKKDAVKAVTTKQ